MKYKNYIPLFIVSLMLLLTNKSVLAQNWLPVNVGLNINVNCVDYTNSTTIFMASSVGITKSIDGGNNWNTWPYLDNLGDTIYDVEFYDLHFFDDYIGLATGILDGGNVEVIYHTVNGGQNWSVVSTSSQGSLPRVLNDIEFINANLGFAVGTNGRILRTTDAGATWNQMISNSNTELHSISFATALIGTAVGNSEILRTTDGGNTWTPTSMPNYLFKKVQFSSNMVGYAVGNAIFKTTNGGLNWSEMSSIDAVDIFATNNDTLFICNANLLKSINQGQYWFTQLSVPTANYNDIDFLDNLNAYVVGNNGQVFKTTTGGESFAGIDAGIDIITPTTITSCSAPTLLKTRVKNYGTTTINTLEIHWSINGIAQNVVNWSGTIASNALSSLISLGNVAFSGSSLQIKVWTNLPNGLADLNTINDTLIDSLTTPYLSGTYTIGGANPDFVNLTAAVASLNNAQICGNVVFNIRDGIYNEHIIFNNVNVANNGTITFQSESGDSSAVKIVSNNFAAFEFMNTKNVHFKKITVNTGYDESFLINNDCNNISVKNCSLTSLLGTVSDYIIVSNISNMVVENTIFNGFSGILLFGNYVAENNLVVNNIFNIKKHAVTVVGVKNVAIRGNTINTNPIYSEFTAISFTSGLGNCEVSGNKIFINQNVSVNSGSSGLKISYSVYNTFNDTFKVFNNYINVMANYSESGIAIDGSLRNLKIYNNTINIRGNSNLSSGITSNVTVFSTIPYQFYVVNNIITNTTGPTIKITNPFNQYLNEYFLNNYFTKIGNNAYFGPPEKLFYLTSFYPYLSFDVWKNFINEDSTSIYVNPQFISDTDFHIYPQTVNYALSNAGVPFENLNVDIEGNIRSATPDIGADEFEVPANDIEIYAPYTNSVVCTGNNQIEVFLINHGTTPVNTATINWTLNGIAQTPYNFNGTVAANDTSSIINLGNFNLNAGAHQLKLWNTLIGASLDFNHLNDTIIINISSGGLSGLYTIGAAPSDFLTVQQALTSLYTTGVCGPVVFDIKPGIYSDSIRVGNIESMTAINTVTFRAQNGDSTSVTLNNFNSTNTDYVIELKESKYFRFEKLTLSAQGIAVSIDDSVKSLVFKGCKFITQNSNSNLIDISNAKVDDIILDGNYFELAAKAINIQGQILNRHSNITIKNNVFRNLSASCIDAIYCNKISILNNNFLNNIGIPSQNDIKLSFTTLITEIGYNIFSDRSKGIFISNHFPGYNSKVLIHNNFMSTILQSTFLTAQNNHAVCNIINNTVYNRANVTINDAYTYAYSLLNLSGINFKLYNNILASISPNMIFINTNWHPDTITSDYNIFYKPTQFPFKNNTSLYQHQTFTGNDTHSFLTNPLFVSNTDLHVGNNYYANNNGSNAFLSFANKDIDGQTRSNTPDIGADEFVLNLQPNNDAGTIYVADDHIICNGIYPIKIALKNYASANLNSAVINWTVNGTSQTPYNWSGILPSLQVDTLVIGYYNFNNADTFNVKIWSHLPNGAADVVNSNDTIVMLHLRTKLSGAYTIGGSNPDYDNIDDFIYDLTTYGVCGPTTALLRQGYYGLSIPEYLGASEINTLTIRSESGNPNDVVFWGSDIIGTDYLTIRDVNFAYGNTANVTLDLQENAVNLFLINNIFEGSITCNGFSFQNFTIDSCIFDSLTFIYIDPIPNLCKNFTFTNNDAYRLDVMLIDSITISNNKFVKGIEVSSDGYLLIDKNSIIGNFSTGIFAANDLIVPGSGIFNNEIIGTGNVNNQTGIGILYSNNLKIMHNSIKISNNANGSRGLIVDENNSEIYNNIISVPSGNFISSSQSFSINYTSNNNVFYSNGNFSVKHLTTTYTSFAAYQNATGNDTNSLIVNPLFQSNSNLYPLQALVHSAGVGVGIADDIEGYSRNPLTPTIGAYEYTAVPAVNLGPDTMFCGNQILDASSSGANYLWNDGTTASTITTSGTGWYWVVVSNSLGTATDSIYITINPPLNLQLNTSIDSVCTNACVAFNANVNGGLPNYNYHWSPGNLMSDSTVFNPTSCQTNQLYLLTVTDQNGCVDTTSYYFINPLVPTIDINSVPQVCNGQAILLNAQTNCTTCTYSWSPNQSLGSPNNITTYAYPNQNTMYTLTVTTSAGCSNQDSVMVEIISPPSVPTISQTFNGLVCDSIANNYQWYFNGTLIPGATNNYYNTFVSGNYTVVVSNLPNCTSTSANFLYTYVVSNAEIAQTAFVVFPNPANEIIYCNLPNANQSNISIEIYDIVGNLLDKKLNTQGNALVSFNIAAFSNGLYFVKMFNGDRHLIASKKVIISK